MKATCTFTQVEVTIPETADGWQLYSDMKGSESAAMRLAKAMEKAINAPNDTEALSIMRKALEAEGNFGAQDTEPCACAEGILGRARRNDFGWQL